VASLEVERVKTVWSIAEVQSSAWWFEKFQAAGIAQRLFRIRALGSIDEAEVIASGILQIFCEVPEACVGGFNASLAAL